jgi:copper chaperone CopZ
MKTIKYLISIITLFIGLHTFAQNHDHHTMATSQTDTFKVSGNCGMCKSRIEKAAKIEGVTKAEWNQKTKLIVVTYDPAKTNSDDVQKKIALVGHDTEKFSAEDKTYNSLPGCCKYERKK